LKSTQTPSRVDSNAILRVLGATLGTLPVALLICAGFARFVPISPDTRFAIAYAGLIPLWLAAMCVALLARTTAHIRIVAAVSSAALGAIVYGTAH
jgi:hypothetical protein